MGCWSVALVVFFSTLDYQILSSPYVIVSVCHRLRMSSSPNLIVSESFISVLFIYVWI